MLNFCLKLTDCIVTRMTDSMSGIPPLICRIAEAGWLLSVPGVLRGAWLIYPAGPGAAQPDSTRDHPSY